MKNSFSRCFSALQRAENSSIVCALRLRNAASAFQCSSASRKFLNVAVASRRREQHLVSVLFSEPKIPQSATTCAARSTGRGFSALQRAENSSIAAAEGVNAFTACFSALQRAENSSIVACVRQHHELHFVSVLFSEPKIPQCGQLVVEHACGFGFSALQRAENSSIGFSGDAAASGSIVSVLFSEPKIPQWRRRMLCER